MINLLIYCNALNFNRRIFLLFGDFFRLRMDQYNIVCLYRRSFYLFVLLLTLLIHYLYTKIERLNRKLKCYKITKEYAIQKLKEI